MAVAPVEAVGVVVDGSRRNEMANPHSLAASKVGAIRVISTLPTSWCVHFMWWCTSAAAWQAYS